MRAFVLAIAPSLFAFAVGDSKSELSVIRLRSGEVVVGSARSQGDRVIVRRSVAAGEPREESFAESDVLSVTPQETVRKQCADLLRATPQNDAHRCMSIGRIAAEARCVPEMQQALDAAAASGEDAAKIREILQPIASQDAAAVPSALTRTRARQLLEKAGAATSRTEGELARLTLAALPKSELIPALEIGLIAKQASTRREAADALAAVAPTAKSEALVRRVLHDPEIEVRDAAAKAIAKGEDPKAFGSVLHALDSGYASSRVHAAEALGAMGSREAVPALVNRLVALQGGGGGGTTAPRAYFFSGTQQAYVADYNVEVAQASAIAEPVIGVLQDGVVLDVRLLGVSREITVANEVQAVRGALAKIAGKDLGDKPLAWANWYNRTLADAAAASPTTPGKTPAR